MFIIKVNALELEVSKEELCKKSEFFSALIKHELEQDNDIKEYVFDRFGEEEVTNFVKSIKDEPIEFNHSNIAESCVLADYVSDLEFLKKCSNYIIDTILHKNNMSIFKIAVTLISRLVMPELTAAVLKIISKNPQYNKKSIEEIGISKFSDIIPLCQLVMKDKMNIYMGRSYFRKVNELFKKIFNITEEEMKAYLDPENIKSFCHNKELNFIVPWALEENDKLFVNSQELKKTNSISRAFSTHAKFDPVEWSISGIKIFFLKLYGNKYRGKGNRPIAGFEITYRNIWTLVTKKVPFQLDQQEGLTYSSYEFHLNEGETIKKLEIVGEHRIDMITFYSSFGREFGPFGRSILPEDRLKTQMVVPKKYNKNNPSKNSFIMSEMITQIKPEPKEAVVSISANNRNNHLQFPYIEMKYNAKGFHGLALHGFTYTIMRRKKFFFWGWITPVFSGIPGELIKENPGINWDCTNLIL